MCILKKLNVTFFCLWNSSRNPDISETYCFAKQRIEIIGVSISRIEFDNNIFKIFTNISSSYSTISTISVNETKKHWNRLNKIKNIWFWKKNIEITETYSLPPLFLCGRFLLTSWHTTKSRFMNNWWHVVGLFIAQDDDE